MNLSFHFSVQKHSLCHKRLGSNGAEDFPVFSLSDSPLLKRMKLQCFGAIPPYSQKLQSVGQRGVYGGVCLHEYLLKLQMIRLICGIMENLFIAL